VGGRAPACLATLDGVRKSVPSGAINSSDRSWYTAILLRVPWFDPFDADALR
jgi:hypothetical protein